MRNEELLVFPLVLRHECRALYKSASAWISFLALAAGAIYGLLSGASAAAAQAEKYRRTESVQLQRIEDLRRLAGNVNVEAQDAAALADGLKVTLPVKPLSPLAIGQSDILPSTLGVGLMNKQRQPEDRYGYENPLQLRAGRVDMAFVVIFILPLVVIALSYNVLSGESEGGTLPFLLTAPVRVVTLLLAKLVPRFALCLGTLLIPAAFWLDWSRGLMLWAAATSGYGLFWCGAAAIANTRGSNSARNAISLLSLWLLLVIILPQIVSGVATLAYPVRLRIDAVNASRQPLNFIEDLPRLAREWYERNPNLISKEWNADKVPVALGPGFNLVQAEMDRLARPVEKVIEAGISQRQSIVVSLSFLSPAALLRELTNEIAGTGLSRHQSFRTQVDDFRVQWRLFFIPRTIHDYKMTPSDYDAAPRFVFHEASTEERSRVLWMLAGILSWAASPPVFLARRRRGHSRKLLQVA